MRGDRVAGNRKQKEQPFLQYLLGYLAISRPELSPIVHFFEESLKGILVQSMHQEGIS